MEATVSGMKEAEAKEESSQELSSVAGQNDYRFARGFHFRSSRKRNFTSTLVMTPPPSPCFSEFSLPPDAFFPSPSLQRSRGSPTWKEKFLFCLLFFSLLFPKTEGKKKTLLLLSLLPLLFLLFSSLPLFPSPPQDVGGEDPHHPHRQRRRERAPVGAQEARDEACLGRRGRVGL